MSTKEFIVTSEFVDKLIDKGIKEVVGVPCSTMTPLINELCNRKMYRSFANEGDAVSYAAGHNLEGVEVAVVLQNSGLTNASSPISSLTSLYDVPMLYFVGWRGYLGQKDEPQHAIMGPNTPKFISSIAPKSRTVDVSSFDRSMDIRNDTQTFVMVTKGSFEKVELSSNNDYRSNYNSENSRMDIIKLVHEFSKKHKDVLVLTTTGFTSREMLSLGEEFNRNFYMFGSMGCLISFATGVARKYPDKKIIVIDGDGSALMRLEGSFTPIKYHQDNIFRIVVMNGEHQSTGGQFLEDIEYLASVSSYLTNILSTLYHIDDLEILLNAWYKDTRNYVMKEKANTTLPCQVIFSVNNKVDKNNLPRPTKTPQEIKENFIGGVHNKLSY